MGKKRCDYCNVAINNPKLPHLDHRPGAPCLSLLPLGEVRDKALEDWNRGFQLGSSSGGIQRNPGNLNEPEQFVLGLFQGLRSRIEQKEQSDGR